MPDDDLSEMDQESDNLDTAERPIEAKEYTDTTIADNVDRIEEVIDILENGEPDLQQAKRLRDEGEARLAALEDQLELGDTSIRTVT